MRSLHLCRGADYSYKMLKLIVGGRAKSEKLPLQCQRTGSWWPKIPLNESKTWISQMSRNVTNVMIFVNWHTKFITAKTFYNTAFVLKHTGNTSPFLFFPCINLPNFFRPRKPESSPSRNRRDSSFNSFFTPGQLCNLSIWHFPFDLDTNTSNPSLRFRFGSYHFLALHSVARAW